MKPTTKKGWFGVIGLFMLVGSLNGDQLGTLNDWSTAQLVGYNLWTVCAIFGGGYLVYWGLMKK